MRESSTPTITPGDARERGRFARSNGSGRDSAHPPRPKLKKLRLAAVLLGLSALALVSTVFGMLMAVASDLPALENEAEYNAAENSTLFADTPGCRVSDTNRCQVVAKLTGNQNRILLNEDEISANIKNAVIAIEDRRFYSHEGVDYRGIARALAEDLLQRGAVQGGSTITQQFVKNALSAQGDRSVLQKLREAALAYHLEREWPKDKILTQYLNTVYFGNGAYGVESAARTYFGDGEGALPVGAGGELGSQESAAGEVSPAEAALLAGIIASPASYDPVENPRRARQRRDLVLARMLEQGTISRNQYRDALSTSLPAPADVDPPRVDSTQAYFSSWLTQQLVDDYGPGVVFGGDLKIKTTIDPELQTAAEQAIAGRLTGVGPNASLVAIENKSGEVKAMVGGEDFDSSAFNLATNGHRQPGSAFKPFILLRALADGISPEATFASQPKEFEVPGSPGEVFPVRNYEDQYYGVASLRAATAVSDNSIFSELGIQVGTKRVARLARRMGVRTRISTNPAMTLGGLEQGLTPLELAYAYATIANKGIRRSGTLATRGDGPVGVEWVKGKGRKTENEPREERVFSEAVGESAHELLAGVVSGGTGKAAQIGEFAAGKTGTTENYGDAWFVGFNEELTVAVWVGYADSVKAMETEFGGSPVAGGTYPALIWHDLMTAWIGIRDRRAAERGETDNGETVPAPSVAPTTTGPEAEGEGETGPADEPVGTAPDEPEAVEPAPEEPEPPPEEAPETPTPAPEPSPTPAPTPGGGAGDGGAGDGGPD